MSEASPRMSVAVVVVGALSVLLVFMLAPYGLATTPDPLSYINIARNVHDGHGVVVKNRKVSRYGRDDYHVEATWPPLYPVAIAALPQSALNVGGLRWLSVLCLSVSALFVWLVLTRMLAGITALLASLLFMCTIPMLTVYSYAWSETVFIALIAGAIAAAVGYLNDDASGRGYAWLALMTVFVALLPLTRYIGLVFLRCFQLFFFSPGTRAVRPAGLDRALCSLFSPVWFYCSITIV